MSVGLSSSGLSQNDVGGKLKNCAGIMQSKVSFHARFYNMPPISVGMVTRMSRFLECWYLQQRKGKIIPHGQRGTNSSSSEMAGAIDRRKRWPVEWQKKRRRRDP